MTGRGAGGGYYSSQGRSNSGSWYSDSQRPNKRQTEEEIKNEKERFEKMPDDERRKLYKCGQNFERLEGIDTMPEYFQGTGNKGLRKGPKPKFDVDEMLNKKISLWVGDITTLEIDAIVNAANSSLLGGGGVDGCIHRAAGPQLKKECGMLHGCDTGDCKISCGYRLPAKYVIHTVGPMGLDQRKLESCYNRCLDTMKENDLHSIAFPCVSTGIYGYPNEDACKVALRTTRQWLETEDNASQVDRIIFCLFLETDIKLYEKHVKVYFPLDSTQADGDSEEEHKAEHPKSRGPGLLEQHGGPVDKPKKGGKKAASVEGSKSTGNDTHDAGNTSVKAGKDAKQRKKQQYESVAENKKQHRKSGEPGMSEEHHASMKQPEEGDKTSADDSPAAGVVSVKPGKNPEVEKSPKSGDSSDGNSKKNSKATGGEKSPKGDEPKRDNISKTHTKSTEKGSSKKDGKSGEAKPSEDSKSAKDGKTTEDVVSKKTTKTSEGDKSAEDNKLAEGDKTKKDMDEDKPAAADKSGVEETAMDVDVSASQDSQEMRVTEGGGDTGEEEPMEFSQGDGTGKKGSSARDESSMNPTTSPK